METLSHRSVKRILAVCSVSKRMSIFDVCSSTFATTACNLRISDGEEDGYTEASVYSEQQTKKSITLKKQELLTDACYFYIH